MDLPPDLVDQAADLLAQADALIVTAGAGMGVDSGLPDFRGRAGFWQAYPALARARLDFAEVASPATFQRDPLLAWGFYGHRLQLYRACVPHAGFGLLLRWGQRTPHGLAVFTSNVDGQFQKAGFLPPQVPVHECHGSIHHLQCLKGCCDDIWPADGFVPQVDTDACRLLNAPPACPHCGGLARPNVLMFGDWDWQEARQQQQARSLNTRLAKVQRPLVVELGAGTAIPSVRHFGEQVVRELGGRLVRINPREYQVPSRLDVGLAVGALAGLVAMDAAWQRASPGAIP